MVPPAVHPLSSSV